MTSTPTPPPVLVEREPGLIIARMNRPQALNSLSPDLRDMLEAVIAEAEADPQVRALLLTGVGRAFCAGGDVSGMGTRERSFEQIVENMGEAHRWLKRLRLAHTIVVSAVNGVAAGGGFGLALLGDVIVASEAAYFKSAFTALGAAADFGLGWTLPRAVGQVRAREILFSERRIEAAEALAIGLVGRVFPAETFEAETLAIARQIARGPLSMGLSKRLLNHEDAASLDGYFAAEARAQAQAFLSADFREGVSAFREKRPATFSMR